MGRKKTIDEQMLLDTARGVFLEQGVSGTTKEIAKRMGISEAAIFARYPTKTDLFVAALMSSHIDAENLIASEIDDPREALIETGNRLLRYFRSVIPMALRLMENSAVTMDDLGSNFGHARVGAVADRLAGYLQRKDAEGVIKVTSPLATAHLFISALHSLPLYELMKFHRTDNLDHAVGHFVDALMAGLPPGKGRPDG